MEIVLMSKGRFKKENDDKWSSKVNVSIMEHSLRYLGKIAEKQIKRREAKIGVDALLISKIDFNVLSANKIKTLDWEFEILIEKAETLIPRTLSFKTKEIKYDITKAVPSDEKITVNYVDLVVKDIKISNPINCVD